MYNDKKPKRAPFQKTKKQCFVLKTKSKTQTYTQNYHQCDSVKYSRGLVSSTNKQKTNDHFLML